MLCLSLSVTEQMTSFVKQYDAIIKHQTVHYLMEKNLG